jgi:hypothetical protein
MLIRYGLCRFGLRTPTTDNTPIECAAADEAVILLRCFKDLRPMLIGAVPK